jgi:glycine dehydrogenase subunit 1
MPFIPHTQSDIDAMLAAIGASSIDALFDEIPASLKTRAIDGVPPGLTEMEIARLMTERAESDGRYLNFIGAGAYEHHIPAAVWQIATRGEFYSAYTPYQAEASQGTLQTLYEFQSMIASLTGLDVANASLYDGASALGEAILMAVRVHESAPPAAARLHKSARRVLLPRALHPHYRGTADAVVVAQNIELSAALFDVRSGQTDITHAPKDGLAAVVIQQPNFFGVLEDVDALTDWAHAAGALVIAVVNPMSLGLLKPPGEWGAKGADIAIGEGQPLGVPLSNGGPYFGFMCCKKDLVRQMPGRIVGATVDARGQRGFVLTLQAREQHIRRSKATSNICTNQGLAVTAATIYMSLIGPQGLRRVAQRSHQNALQLVQRLRAIEGVQQVFASTVFNEAVLRLPDVEGTLERLQSHRILGGLSLKQHYPELGECMLVCATETKLTQDIEHYAHCLNDCLHGAEEMEAHPT